MRRSFCAVVALAVVLPLVGCAPKQGASSPADAIKRMTKANRKGDTKLYLTMVRSEDDKAGIKAMMDAMWVKRRFREALIEARGAAAWDAFTSLHLSSGDGTVMSLKDPPSRDVADDQFSFNSETGLVTGPHGPTSVIEEHDGRWYLASFGSRTNEAREKFRQFCVRLGGAYEEHIPLAGNMSISIEQLKRRIFRQANPHITEWDVIEWD